MVALYTSWGKKKRAIARRRYRAILLATGGSEEKLCRAAEQKNYLSCEAERAALDLAIADTRREMSRRAAKGAEPCDFPPLPDTSLPKPPPIFIPMDIEGDRYE